MVGRKVRLRLDKTAAKGGEVALKAEHLSLVDARGVRLLDDVSLELRVGEIVGIAGVSGNGQTELCRSWPASARRPTARSRCAAGPSMPPNRAIPAKCVTSVSRMCPRTACGRAWWRRSARRRRRSWAITTSRLSPPPLLNAPPSAPIAPG
jgi:hypothetical protein